MARKRLALLDETGKKLLGYLNRNARMSLRTLGQAVGLTAPAVAERIARMEEEKIILGYHLTVDYHKAGLPLHLFIMVLNAKDRDLINDIKTRIPEVINYWVLAGEIDYLIELAIPSQTRLEMIIHEIEKIGITRTYLVIYASTVDVMPGPRFPESSMKD